MLYMYAYVKDNPGVAVETITGYYYKIDLVRFYH